MCFSFAINWYIVNLLQGDCIHATLRNQSINFT